MSKTNYRGIDYALGMANIDRESGIRYGVINANALASWVCNAAESVYPDTVEIECEKCGASFDTDNLCPDDDRECPHCHEDTGAPGLYFLEPIGWDYTVNDPDYTTEGGGEDGDIFVVKSKYKTRAQFCSPCAPGACHLENPCDDGEWCYCFGREMFDADSPMPYDCFDLDGKLVARAGEYGD